MGNIRGPDWGKIKEEYIKLNGDVKLKEFAEEHGVKYSTLRSRKNRENWDSEINKNVATKSATRQNHVATENKIKGIGKEPIAKEVKEVLNNSSLTDKQRLFSIYYIKYFNATKAYQKAYGCDYITANAHGYELLSNVVIKQQIESLKKAKLNRILLSEDDIFQKYIDIAFTDINDFMEFGQKEIPELNENGEQKLDLEGNPMTYTVDYAHFKDSSEVDGTLISEVSKGKDGAKIKLQDKMKALQWLGDRMNLLSTETKIRIDNEKAKVQMAREKLDFEKAKTGGDNNSNDGVLKEMLEGLKDGI